MKLYKSWPTHQTKSSSDHHQNKIAPKDRKCKCGRLLPVGILVALLMNLMGLVLVFMLPKEQLLFDGFSAVADARSNQAKAPKVSKDESLQHDEMPKLDKLLGRLLHPGFDERTCLSRYQSVLYLKELKRQPSSFLISKLRSYEALHRRCGPHTESYNRSVELIKYGQQLSPTDCKYVVWIPFSGLGNRILTIASAFLYAILTNRVILVDPLDHTSDLFCEPFRGTSWILPDDFPITDYFDGFDQNSTYCYGYMVKNNLIDKFSASEIPPFIYLNLAYDMDHYDELFFRDQNQMFLQKIPWLTMKSDEYFIPSLFLMPSFKEDLDNMFPDKDAVFHLLGRYLFHPTNPIWGLITRYHQAYLAGADEKIGIQVRVFDEAPGPSVHVLNQIIACTREENILPLVNLDDPQPITSTYRKNKTKAVLMTSLSSWYADVIRDMYLQHSTVTGEIIQVHQPSHEEYQRMDDRMHYTKALAELYLLGMSDTLVTSGWSTLGYVAQGLGGLHSWVLYKPENYTAPNPPCQRVFSMEPCFHLPPLDNTMELFPYIGPCEDRIRGLKLYQDINS